MISLLTSSITCSTSKGCVPKLIMNFHEFPFLCLQYLLADPNLGNIMGILLIDLITSYYLD